MSSLGSIGSSVSSLSGSMKSSGADKEEESALSSLQQNKGQFKVSTIRMIVCSMWSKNNRVSPLETSAIGVLRSEDRSIKARSALSIFAQN